MICIRVVISFNFPLFYHVHDYLASLDVTIYQRWIMTGGSSAADFTYVIPVCYQTFYRCIYMTHDKLLNLIEVCNEGHLKKAK